jgi:predicted MFS family arabinose efflux permease
VTRAAAPPGAGHGEVAVRAAVRATSVAFIGSGLAFASWVARIPQIRDRLDLDPAALGLVLLSVAAGSVLALPLSGTVIHRIGSRRTVAAMALLLCVGLTVVAAGYRIGTAPVVIGLFLIGFGTGAWDVAMNVHGAVAERHAGRSIMPRFHAGFSVGTVAGALVGAAMVATGVDVTAHLAAVAVVVALVVPAGTRRFLPDTAPDDTAPDDTGEPELARPGGGALTAWREPRTLLTGIFVLAFAFAEGTANDWISVAVIDGYGLPAAWGSLALAVFLAAMTAGRWFGPHLLDRYGRVPVVRVLALVGLAGLALFVFSPTGALAFVGALFWGLGASLGFPVGMNAGADDPARAAARVSVVSSIGYCAFLAGPPLIGFLGHHVTVLRALIVVAALFGLAALIASVVAEPARREDPPARSPH